MAELTGPVIVTNYGEQQLLAGTFDVTKLKLGSGIWTPTQASTALLTQEADVPISGTVEPDASGFRLRMAAVDDDDGNTYNLHEFALTDDTDVALAIYSQPTAIAAKALGVDLLFSANWLIDNTAGPITVTGDTTYTLPLASEASAGIIEIANTSETLAGVDTTRAVTPAGVNAAIAAYPFLAPVAAGRIRTGATPTLEYTMGATPNTPSIFGDDLLLGFPSAIAQNATEMIVVASVFRSGQTDALSVLPEPQAADSILFRVNSLAATLDLGFFVCRIHYAIYGVP